MVRLFRFRVDDEKFGKMRRLRGTVQLVMPKAESDGGPYKWWDRNGRRWVTVDFEGLARRVKNKMRNAPLGTRCRFKSNKRYFEILSLYKPWLYLGTLPAQAREHNWSPLMKEHFRWAMWHGCAWYGTYNRRLVRGGFDWSQHSWPGQAHDLGPKDTEHGDKLVKEARRRWGDALFIIWESEDHRNGSPEHWHVEKVPAKTGWPPPQ